jgi:hypothetical protein
MKIIHAVLKHLMGEALLRISLEINGRSLSSISCRPEALGSDLLSVMAVHAQKLSSALNK